MSPTLSSKTAIYSPIMPKAGPSAYGVTHNNLWAPDQLRCLYRLLFGPDHPPDDLRFPAYQHCVDAIEQFNLEHNTGDPNAYVFPWKTLQHALQERDWPREIIS